MTLLTAQTLLLNALVADVAECWGTRKVYTDQPTLPPTGRGGERPLPEASVSLVVAALDRPEQMRLTAPCLELIPETSVRLDVEIILRELKDKTAPLRFQVEERAQQLRTWVLWDSEGDQRRLYCAASGSEGVPAYWLSESYADDPIEHDPQAEDYVLRVSFAFFVTVALA